METGHGHSACSRHLTTVSTVTRKKPGKDRSPQQRRRTRHLAAVPPAQEAGSAEETAGPGSAQAQGLFQMLRKALRADGPLELLATVSSVVTAADPRMRDPFAGDGQPAVALDELIESFVGVDYAETTAALTVLQHLVPDDLLAARIGKVVKARRQPMPPWLTGLGDVHIGRVVEMTNVLGDGDDYFVELRFPTGETLTALVYVDHNMGGIVKDAFVIADSFDAVEAVFHEKVDDPETTFADVDPAVARAVVEEAIERGARTFPQPETETWPAARPLVEWIVGMLPPGGEVPARREWSDHELAALREEFFASPYGRDVDGPDERGLAEDFTWYAGSYGTGDPLRWSAVRVEVLLVDWIPRKIVADVGYLAKAPDLLRRFIRYCHERVGLRPALTEEVVAAVGHWEGEYQRLIRSERPQGADALARRMLEERGVGGEAEPTIAEIMLESLDRAVGGRGALMNLHTGPLPDEPFVWAGVPEDVHDRVREVLELCDGCADELFDVEHRTAFRRFLSRAAAADPVIFRRKAAANRAAAAVCWAIGRANDSVGVTGAVESGELSEWFGVKGSASQRADVFLRANGVNPHTQFGRMDLGAPDLLTAARREHIVELRDRYLSWEE